MESRSFALTVGFFIIGFIVALAICFRWLQGDKIPQTLYYIVTETAIVGLSEGSDVRVQGLSVGKIVGFHFDPKDRRKVLIRVMINSDIPITTGTYAKTVIQSIAGQSALELEDEPGDHPPLKPGPGEKAARIPMRPSTIENLSVYIKTFFDDSRELLQQIRKVLSDENIQAVSNSLNNVDRATKELLPLISSLEKTSLAAQGSLDNVDRLIKDDTTAAIKDVQTLADEATKLARDLNQNSTNLLGDVRDDVLPRINRTLNDLERTSHNLDRLSTEFASNPSMLLRGVKTQPGPGEPGFNQEATK